MCFSPQARPWPLTRPRSIVAALLLALAVWAAHAPAGQAATLYVAPSGSGSTCTSLVPCGTFDAAYAAAAPGDTVQVAGGSYPAQTIQSANKAAGPQVSFQPALGATVTVSDINIWRSHVGIADMTVRDVTIRKQDIATPPPVDDVTLRRLKGRNFNIFDATNVQVLGGDWGPASACGGTAGGGNNSLRRLQGTVPTHILIDGVTIHDVQSYDLVACHIEGLAIFAGSDVTVRNSKFYGNSVYDIFLQNNSGPIDTITFENNWFASPVGTTGTPNGTSIAFSTVPNNVTIRQNSFNAQMSLDDNGTNPTYVGWTITGNVGPLQWNACSYSGIVWRYNAWTNRNCGTTDINLNVATPPFVKATNDATADYHLTGGGAVDFVPVAESAATDIDGETRPMGAAADAGADERTGIVTTDTTPPDTTITSAPSSSTSTSASVAFTSTESGSTFACRIDGGAWGACTSPKAYSGLTVGTHTFDVRATDAAGNTDATPATTTWTVSTAADTTPPDTTITSAPSSSTSTSASVAFTSTESGSTFECRIDGGAWGACTSPKAYSGLTVGSHTFDVRATDAAGNTDATPATTTWTVSTALTGSTVYLAPTGSDSNACTQAAPCKTLSRGYTVASPGQTVELAAGTYADTSLPADATKTSTTDVVFAPAAGAAVTLSSALHITAQHLTIKGMTLAQRLNIDPTAADVTLLNDDMATFTVMSDGAQAPKDISFIGGDLGPAVDENNLIASNGTATTASPQNILIDGVKLHDFTLSSGSTAHVECLQVWAAQGLTIRNSKFSNCEVFDVFLQKLPNGSAATPSNIQIENNTMDCCRSGFFAIRLADYAGTLWQNITIRNNSLDKPINPDGGVPYSNVNIVNNVGPKVDFYTASTGVSGPPPAGVNVDYNVWYAGTKIGTHDQVAPSGFKDPANLDFHLVAGAAAIDHADATNAPATDEDGDARPQGVAPDAGADEVLATTVTDTTPPDTAITSSPASSTTSTTASFAFTSTESPSTFACRLDGGTWGACTSPKAYSGLAVGTHTFDVRATDAAGNTDATPATVTWSITPPPDTTAPSVPANLRATSTTTSSVALAWDAATDTGGSGLKGYVVYRGTVALNATPQTGTTFTDSGLSSATTYAYTVKAVDNAGNVSAASAPLSVTTAPLPSLTFTPTADAQLRKSKPNSNAGSGTRMTIGSSPVNDDLVAFTVSGVGTNVVTRARLRLYAYDGTTTGGTLRPTATGWNESTVTWNTAPLGSGSTPAATFGAVSTGQWVDVDVTSLVKGDGAISLRLAGTSDAATFNTRENSVNRPQLVVDVASPVTGASVHKPIKRHAKKHKAAAKHARRTPHAARRRKA